MNFSFFPCQIISKPFKSLELLTAEVSPCSITRFCHGQKRNTDLQPDATWLDTWMLNGNSFVCLFFSSKI